MTLTLNDVRLHDCFRFIGEGAKRFDSRPTYASTRDENRIVDISGWDELDVDDKNTHQDWWEHYGKLPIELLEHYERAPAGEVLTRRHISVGECFEYVDDRTKDMLGRPILMVKDLREQRPAGIPQHWIISPIDVVHANSYRVRRIPRWDHVGEWRGLPLAGSTAPAAPAVGTTLHRLLEVKVGDLTGEECADAFEKAMQTESLCRIPGTTNQFVSTLGGAGLNGEQVAHARLVWAARLAEMQAAARAEDKAREVTVVVDSGVEPE